MLANNADSQEMHLEWASAWTRKCNEFPVVLANCADSQNMLLEWASVWRATCKEFPSDSAGFRVCLNIWSPKGHGSRQSRHLGLWMSTNLQSKWHSTNPIVNHGEEIRGMCFTNLILDQEEACALQSLERGSSENSAPIGTQACRYPMNLQSE